MAVRALLSACPAEKARRDKSERRLLPAGKQTIKVARTPVSNIARKGIQP